MTNNLKPLRRLGAQQPQPQQQRRQRSEQTGDLSGKKASTGILGAWNPPPLSKIEDTGISKLALADLVL